MATTTADDRLALGVAAGLEVQATANTTSTDIPNLVDTAAIARSVEVASRSLASVDVNPKEFTPSTLQTLGAYFRTENTVGSALSSKSLAETLFPTPDSPPVDTTTIMQTAERDGLTPYLHKFDGVKTIAEYTAIKADLERELEDQRTIQASTGISSVAMMLAAGIIDVPTLLPGSIGVRLGAKGVGYGRVMAGAAGAASVDATVTELVLHGTQVDRSLEDSAYSIGGSIILGGALGSGLHALARRSLGNDILDRAGKRTEEAVADIAAGSPAAKSAGAAAVDTYEAMRARGIDENKPISSFGMNEMLKKLGEIPGFIGRNIRIPFLDIDNAQAPSVIAARDALMFSPQIRKGDVQGSVHSGPTVIGLVRDIREEYGKVAEVVSREFDANKAAFNNDYKVFDAQVTRALLDPMLPAHPAVKAAAQHHRALYDKVLDGLIENGVLPEAVRTKYGKNYVPMMFEGATIREKPQEFMDMIERGFQRMFREEAEEALRAQSLRRTQNEEARARIMGVVEKRPVRTDGVEELRRLQQQAERDAADLSSGKLVPGDGSFAEVPSGSLKVGGVRVEISGSPGRAVYQVFDGDKQVGGFTAEIGPDGKSVTMMNAGVDKAYQRKGIATAVYDDLASRASDSNLSLMPSRADALTAEGEAFWRNRLGQPVVNQKTGKQKQETVIVKEGALQERLRVTKEQYELEVDRVKENKALAEAVHDADTRTAQLQVDNIYDQYKFERQKQYTQDLKSAFSRVVGETDTTVAARKREALEFVTRLEEEFTGSIKAVDRLYTEAAEAIEAETRRALRLAERGDLSSRERLSATNKAYQEQRRLLAANERERRKEMDRLTGQLEKKKAELVGEVEEYIADIDREVAKVTNQLKAQHKRDIASIEAERSRQAEAIKARRKRTREELAKSYDDELAEAKKIRDANLLNANEVSARDYAAARAPLREGLEDGLKFVRDGAVDDKIIADEARALAKVWYDKTTGWGKQTLEHELPGFANMLKKRRTPVSHMDLLNAGFVRGDSIGLLEDYTRMAGTDSALAAVFKKSVKTDGDLRDVGDLKLGAVKDDIRAEYDQLRDAIFSSPDFDKKMKAIEKKYAKLIEGADDAKKTELYTKAKEEEAKARAEVEKKLADERDRQLENLDSVIDSIRGTNSHGWSQNAMKAAEMVTSINYLRLMGGVVLSSLTDPIKIAKAAGFGNMMKGAMLSYQQTFASGWKTANAVEKGLTRAGAAMAELNLQARMSAMADIGNPLRTADTSITFMRRATDIFSSATGIKYWNGFWKQTAENATSAYLGQLAYKGWDNLSKSERGWLGSLRINADGLNIIRAAHEAQPGGKYFDDWPILVHEKWSDQEAARLVRHALGEELNNAVITPQAYDRMMFAQTPGGKMLWQFRQHMVSNQMRFIGRQAQLASLDNREAVALGGAVFGLVLAGALVDFMKQASGQLSPIGNVDPTKSPIERQMEEWTKTPGMALYNALDRSDTLGIVMEGSSILDKLGLIGPKWAMQKPFDDPEKVKEASRFKNRSPLDVVAGPTAGLVTDVVGAAKTLGKVVTGQPITRGDFRSTERIIPGQNIPYIQLGGNAFERYLGDTYGWPAPK